MNNLIDKEVTDKKDANIIYDDFLKIGRGVDIDDLTEVILLIPLYAKFDIIGLDFTEFK